MNCFARFDTRRIQMKQDHHNDEKGSLMKGMGLRICTPKKAHVQSYDVPQENGEV